MCNRIKSDRIEPKTPRKIRLDLLEKYYLRNLVEDPMDGTSLDCDVLDMIKKLQEKYKDDQ